MVVAASDPAKQHAAAIVQAGVEPVREAGPRVARGDHDTEAAVGLVVGGALVDVDAVVAVVEGLHPEIRDTKFGFATVTTKALLAFIVTKYDVITPNELTQNRALLEEAWDITKPIMGL